MLENQLFKSVITHTNRKYFLTGLLDGTNRWFYDVMSRIHPTWDAEKTSSMLRGSLQSYIMRLYNIHRRYGWTDQMYFEFYHDNPDTINAAMSFLLNTLHTQYKNYYLAAVLALWVELERKEGDYAEYVRICTGQEDDGFAVEVNPFLLYNFVCSTFTGVQEVELPAVA
jgi:hypothetical protein